VLMERSALKHLIVAGTEINLVCIVYLKDIPRKPMTENEWFDQGWTLQGLIAPKAVSFFDQKWNSLGTKTQGAVAQDKIPCCSTHVVSGKKNH
jgi:hypothetical protein